MCYIYRRLPGCTKDENSCNAARYMPRGTSCIFVPSYVCNIVDVMLGLGFELVKFVRSNWGSSNQVLL